MSASNSANKNMAVSPEVLQKILLLLHPMGGTSASTTLTRTNQPVVDHVPESSPFPNQTLPNEDTLSKYLTLEPQNSRTPPQNKQQANIANDHNINHLISQDDSSKEELALPPFGENTQNPAPHSKKNQNNNQINKEPGNIDPNEPPLITESDQYDLTAGSKSKTLTPFGDLVTYSSVFLMFRTIRCTTLRPLSFYGGLGCILSKMGKIPWICSLKVKLSPRKKCLHNLQLFRNLLGIDHQQVLSKDGFHEGQLPLSTQRVSTYLQEDYQ
jgi:hypothetical protein